MDNPETPTTRLLHQGEKFDYVEASWTTPDGRTLTRQFVRHGGSVVIVPILEERGERKVVLIRNRRPSIPAVLWELPAGTREGGEEPLECAARELEEETGYAADRVEKLCSFYTSPGMTNELMHAFVATGLRHVGQRLEVDEGITVHPMSVAEMWGLVDRGELMDAKTLAALMVSVRRGVL